MKSESCMFYKSMKSIMKIWIYITVLHLIPCFVDILPLVLSFDGRYVTLSSRLLSLDSYCAQYSLDDVKRVVMEMDKQRTSNDLTFSIRKLSLREKEHIHFGRVVMIISAKKSCALFPRNIMWWNVDENITQWIPSIAYRMQFVLRHW